jgi:predicted nucleic acid-binding protein
VILVDTGPLVALFDRRDRDHVATVAVLRTISEPLVTTAPVLTEAFHLLAPASQGAVALRSFIRRGGLGTWFLSEVTLARALELMDRYADHAMDLADASLVAAAEVLRTTAVLTLDRGDFATYRARIGRSARPFRLIDPVA